jgi:cytochrome c oxidase subunit 1
VLAVVGSAAIGILLGTLLTIRFLPTRALIRFYIEVWRGLPIVVTIFLTGIANYMVPIMIGARDMAFPRVNLLGFWLVPVSIILYYGGFFTGGALDAGWTGYAPLTEKAYQSHSLGVDFWALSIIVWAISGIMASTNFLTTIVALRAPGMKLTRLPLFVWAQISTSILLLVVGAPLAAAMILVEFDRQLGELSRPRAACCSTCSVFGHPRFTS